MILTLQETVAKDVQHRGQLTGCLRGAEVGGGVLLVGFVFLFVCVVVVVVLVMVFLMICSLTPTLCQALCQELG